MELEIENLPCCASLANSLYLILSQFNFPFVSIPQHTTCLIYLAIDRRIEKFGIIEEAFLYQIRLCTNGIFGNI